MKYTVEFTLIGKKFVFRNVSADNHFDAQKAVVDAVGRAIKWDSVLEQKEPVNEPEFQALKDIFAGAGIKL